MKEALKTNERTKNNKTKATPLCCSSPFLRYKLLNAEQVCATLTNRVFFIQRLRLIVEISLSISSLTYCTSPPHVCALASPSHLLINFTNSSYHSSFQYTITRSNSPAIKSLIPFLIHHFCSSLFQLQVLKFNFI